MGTEKFCLRWNDFETNISSAIKEIKEDKDFFDVTIACDDDQIQAHKVIISACSPFFRTVLKRNPHQHPLLYLKGVKYTDLQAVLDFMYYGEVNVAQEELNSFLAVAEDLRVKGLTQNTSGSKESRRESQHAFKSPTLEQVPDKREKKPLQTIPVSKLQATQARPQTKQADDIQEVISVKSEPQDPAPRSGRQMQPVALASVEMDEERIPPYQEDQVYEDYDQYEEQQYDEQPTDLTIQGDEQGKGTAGPLSASDLSQYVVSDQNIKQFHCALCHTFKSKLPSKVKHHLEAIHFPGLFLYTCHQCEKTFKGKNAFNIHKTTMHSKKTRLA